MQSLRRDKLGRQAQRQPAQCPPPHEPAQTTTTTTTTTTTAPSATTTTTTAPPASPSVSKNNPLVAGFPAAPYSVGSHWTLAVAQGISSSFPVFTNPAGQSLSDLSSFHIAVRGRTLSDGAKRADLWFIFDYAGADADRPGFADIFGTATHLRIELAGADDIDFPAAQFRYSNLAAGSPMVELYFATQNITQAQHTALGQTTSLIVKTTTTTPPSTTTTTTAPTTIRTVSGSDLLQLPINTRITFDLYLGARARRASNTPNGVYEITLRSNLNSPVSPNGYELEIIGANTELGLQGYWAGTKAYLSNLDNTRILTLTCNESGTQISGGLIVYKCNHSGGTQYNEPQPLIGTWYAKPYNQRDTFIGCNYWDSGDNCSADGRPLTNPAIPISLGVPGSPYTNGTTWDLQRHALPNSSEFIWLPVGFSSTNTTLSSAWKTDLANSNFPFSIISDRDASGRLSYNIEFLVSRATSRTTQYFADEQLTFVDTEDGDVSVYMEKASGARDFTVYISEADFLVGTPSYHRSLPFNLTIQVGAATNPSIVALTPNPAPLVRVTAQNDYTVERVLQPFFHTAGTKTITYSYEVTTTNPLIKGTINEGVLTIQPATDRTAWWPDTESIVVTATARNSAGTDTATKTFNVVNHRIPFAPSYLHRSLGVGATLLASNGYIFKRNLAPIFNLDWPRARTGPRIVADSVDLPTHPITIRYFIAQSNPLINASFSTENPGELTIQPATPTTTWHYSETIIVGVTARNSAGTDSAFMAIRVTRADMPSISPVELSSFIALEAPNNYIKTQNLRQLFRLTEGSLPITYSYEITNANTELISAREDNGVLTIEPATSTTAWTGTRDIVVAATASNDAGTSSPATITFRVTNSRPATAPTISDRWHLFGVTLESSNSFSRTLPLQQLFDTTGTDPEISYDITTTNPLINANINNELLTIRPATSTTAWNGFRSIVVTATATNSAGSDTATMTFIVSNNRNPLPISAALSSSNNYTATYDLDQLFLPTGTASVSVSYSIRNTETDFFNVAYNSTTNVITITPTTTTTAWPGNRTFTVTAGTVRTWYSSRATITFNITNNRVATVPTISAVRTVKYASLRTSNNHTLTYVLQPLFDTTGRTPITYSYEITTTNPLINTTERNGVLTIQPATPTTRWGGTRSIVLTATATNSAGSDTATITFKITNTRRSRGTPIGGSNYREETAPTDFSGQEIQGFDHLARRLLTPSPFLLEPPPCRYC